MNSHYYKILGLPANATLTQIKSAYRRKAKVYHPDVNKHPDAKSMFIQINEAYQCILNEKKGLHNKKYGSQTDFQREKEKIFEEWRQRQQAEAQAKAYYHSEQNFEEFTNSDLFKSASVFYLKKTAGCLVIGLALVAIIGILFAINFTVGFFVALLFVPIVAYVMTWFEQRRK